MNRQQSSLVQSMVVEALDLHRTGRLAEAEQIYRQILSVDPKHSDSLHLLGMIAFQMGRSAESVNLIKKAIEMKGDAASYHSNLGNVFHSQGKLSQAGACYQRALQLKPDSAEIYVNLGNIFKAQGQLDSSLTRYRRALGFDPQLAEAATAEAAVMLLKGDFAAGWLGSERRWNTLDHDRAPRVYPWPRWTGEPMLPGRLLIWPEQGIGDEIMFAGLIPDVIRSGVSCVLDCDPRLETLFARSYPNIAIAPGPVPADHPGLDIVAHLPCGSLPGFFRTSSAAFAATSSPYLLPDTLKRIMFRKRYSDGRKTVGLAWYTANKRTGQSRSVDLSMVAPLFDLAGIRWISLQYGDHDTLEKQVAKANAPILIDRDVDQLRNVDEFAAQIAAMDLVITIDNSTAHLAGALGVPTWVVLPFAPDWRWLLDRSDSPWYPSLRLFRQVKMNDWQSVVQRVGNALRQDIISP